MQKFRIAEWFYLHFYCPNSSVTYDKHISQIDFSFLSQEQRKFFPKNFALYQKLETLTDRQSLLLGIFVLLEMLKISKLNPHLLSHKLLVSFRLKDWQEDDTKTIKLYRQFPNAWVRDRISECDVKLMILDIPPKNFYKNPSNSLEGYVKIKPLEFPSDFKDYLTQEQIQSIQVFQTLCFADIQTQKDRKEADKILEGKISLEESKIWAEANLDFWIDMGKISI